MPKLVVGTNGRIHFTFAFPGIEELRCEENLTWVEEETTLFGTILIGRKVSIARPHGGSRVRDFDRYAIPVSVHSDSTKMSKFFCDTYIMKIFHVNRFLFVR